MARRGGGVPSAAGLGTPQLQLVSPAVSTPKTDIPGASGLNQLAGRLEQDRLARDQVTAVRAETDYIKATDQQIAALDPLSATYEDDVRRITAEGVASSLSSADIKNPLAGEMLKARLERHQQLNVNAALDFRRKNVMDEGVRTRGESEEAILGQIRSDPDGYDAYIQQQGDTNKQLSPAIPLSVAQKMDVAFVDAAISARADGLASQGRFDEAREFIDKSQTVLAPAAYRQARANIRTQESQFREDRLRETSRALADLEIAVAQDRAGLKEIAKADQAGLFKDREQARVSLIKTYEAREKEKREKYAVTADILGRFSSGAGLDTQKEADIAWAAYTRGIPADASPDDVIAHQVTFARKAGWLPSAAKRLVENAERTENPELLAQAALLDRRLQDNAPGVASGARQVDSRVRLTQTFAETTGSNWLDAAKYVMARAPTDADRTARRKDYGQQFKDFDPKKVLDSKDVFDDPSKVPDDVARAFERQTALYYEMTGDKELSIDQAARNMGRNYGPSKVGGVEHVMKFPPERAFPAQVVTGLTEDERTLIMDHDIAQAMAIAGVEPGVVATKEGRASRAAEKNFVKGPGGTERVVAPKDRPKAGLVDESGLPPYSLVSDAKTEAELERYQSGNGPPPSYALHVRSSIGAMVPLSVDGKPVRYQVPSYERLQQNPVYKNIVASKARGAANTKEAIENMGAIQGGTAP